MNKRSNTNRWQAVVIFLIPAVAMGMAWFMYFTGLWIPDGRTNKGELMLPPVSVEALKLQESSNKDDLEMLNGHWGIIVFGDVTCEQEACQESLYKTRQVHIALGKESERLIRLYVSEDTPALSEVLNKEHPEVLWLSSPKNRVLKAMNLQQWPENKFYIVDPLGNIMMGYSPDQAGGELLKDLKKLLKASKIG